MSTWKPTMELRWIRWENRAEDAAICSYIPKDGEYAREFNKLQQKWEYWMPVNPSNYPQEEDAKTTISEWRDVPVMQEGE